MKALISSLQAGVRPPASVTPISLELAVALVLVVLLVRYEYVRRVADVRSKRQVIVTGILTAVMLVLFTGFVVRRVISFIVF